MATQPISMKRLGYFLTTTNERSPLEKYPQRATGSHGGCAICGLSAELDIRARCIRLHIPSEGVIPPMIEIMAILEDDAGEHRYTPDLDTVRALLRERRGEWSFPFDSRLSAGTKMAVYFAFAPPNGEKSWIRAAS